MKLELNISGVRKEIASLGHAATAAIQGTLARQLEELHGGGLISRNDESDCDGKKEIPEEVTPTSKLHIKGISGDIS